MERRLLFLRGSSNWENFSCLNYGINMWGSDIFRYLINRRVWASPKLLRFSWCSNCSSPPSIWYLVGFYWKKQIPLLTHAFVRLSYLKSFNIGSHANKLQLKWHFLLLRLTLSIVMNSLLERFIQWHLKWKISDLLPSFWKQLLSLDFKWLILVWILK